MAIAPKEMHGLGEAGGFVDVNPEELMLNASARQLEAANTTIDRLRAENAQLKQQLLDVYSTLVTDKLSTEN